MIAVASIGTVWHQYSSVFYERNFIVLKKQNQTKWHLNFPQKAANAVPFWRHLWYVTPVW